MNDKKTHHLTHYIHRTSYTSQERMVGVFVLSAIAVLVFLLFSTIKSQNIFEDYFVIYGKLKSAEGLSTETIVQISGIEVGKVAAVDITDDNHIMLTMNIFNRYQRLLRSDSKVKVGGLSSTIIGKSIIVITAGSSDKGLLKAGEVLDVLESSSVEDVISEATVILDVIKQMIHDLSAVVSSVDPQEIASTINSFNNMSKNLESYTQQVNSGKGVLGALVYDDEIKDELAQSVVNLRQITEDLKELSVLLKNDAKQVPAVMNNINSVLGETEKTIQATQKIWPISSAMPDNQTTKTVNSQPAND